MLDSLKKLDKRFLYIFGGIMGLVLLFVIIAVIMKMASGPGKNYQSLEKKLVAATEKYVSAEVTPEISPDGDTMIVSSETLVSGG